MPDMGKDGEMCENRHGKSQVFFVFLGSPSSTLSHPMYTITPQSILGTHFSGYRGSRQMELADVFRGFNVTQVKTLNLWS